VSEVDPEFLKELQAAFVIEGREQLQSFMTSVINLEGAGSEPEKLALAENILHDLHSLKGNSRAAGITTVETVCQALESALLSLRRKNELLKPEAADVFHAAIDMLDDLIARVESETKDYQPEAFPEILLALKLLDERQRAILEAAGDAATQAGQSPQVPAVPSQPEIQGARGEAAAQPSRQTRTQGASAVADKALSTRIALWKLDKMLRESEEMLILKQISEQHLEDIRSMKALSREVSAESLRLSDMLSQARPKGETLSEKDLLAFAESLKSFCKEFELSVIAKMRRQQTEQRLCFNMVDGFIDSVKSLLMQDFSSLLSLVPKIVRDLSRELKKEVDLDIFGTDIEIDRRILEEIKDPLIHLVRNSLDHGIESAEERALQGKPARALLKIGARQDESGNVRLIVSDDGQGIGVERLKAAAVREGAISAEEAERLTDNESLELMYRSAVSTSETVTEISGRGLGMAIVRERIHELGGRVTLETLPGKGTTFTLQLPTKLSTFRGIQVMTAGQSFIIPTLHVHYAGRVLRSEIKLSGNRNTVSVSGQLTSVQALADVLKLAGSSEFKTRASRNYQQLLVLEAGERRAGFLVDEILHEHEVLVRGLSYPLCRVANIAGATILGSGQVVPVLNIADLLETAAKATWADERLTKTLVEDSERARKLSELPVFLVDRHLTSLVMIKTLLESEGYVVNTFDSNESALEGLDENVPLILLKSAELPESQESGLAFWIRKDLRLKTLPIIFYGSDPEAAGEESSKQLGGNAYFSKLDFDRKHILQLIERLI
jgi:two-component system, chemotaxis family, sensor kinase CheA